MPRNIALIGFMGTGKSTVGRMLAERLGWRFIDTDALIVQIAGKEIPTIFSEEGERGFRDRETTAVQGICAGQRQVIATGGGAILRDENVAALRGAGVVVWLTARPELIVERTSRRGGTRPLLQTTEEGETPMGRVLRLLGERGALYQGAAHWIVDTSERTPTSIVAEIVRRLERSGQ